MRVHVCALPNSMSKNDIIEMFEEFGEVSQFKYSGAHAQHCVEFQMPPMAAYQAIAKYDGIELDEVPIKVKVS